MNVRALPAPRTLGIPKLVTITVAVLVVALYVLVSAPFDSDWRAMDVEAYWTAAERLRSGANLYEGGSLFVYTYAPWFAYAWVPLTYLPRELVEVLWLGLLLGCVGWLSFPLLRSMTGAVLAMLIVPQVIEYAWIGNVDPLMLVGLALLRTRAGPVLVGLAASLKVTPIAFVAYYLLRREWWRAGVVVAVAAFLWLPVLAFDLSAYGDVGYITQTTPSMLMSGGPLLWLVAVAVILGAVGLTALRDRRYVLLACTVAAMIGNPRMTLYAVGYLLVPARRLDDIQPPDTQRRVRAPTTVHANHVDSREGG